MEDLSAVSMEDLCASGVNPASRGRNAEEIYPPGGSRPFGAVRDGIQIVIKGLGNPYQKHAVL